MAYGWVEVGYPSDREFGAQSFRPGASHPNPFSYFSIENFGVAGSIDEVRKLAQNKRFGFDLSKHALVYVHGINNSFRDGVERLSQLVVDLGVTGTPLLFSWPADETPVSIFSGSKAYKQTLVMARSSEKYFNYSLDDILSGGADRFDLLAHSMGTLIAFDVLKSRPMPTRTHQGPSGESNLPNAVLAAPDIGMQDFMDGRIELLRRLGRLTVYCGPDLALDLSKITNGEARLGYCEKRKEQRDYVEGVQFVRVYGNFRDLLSHSYYGNIPEVVEDLKHTLMETGDNQTPTPYREIFLND
jgi:esterase/lipase superfamily enzyme